MYRFIARLNDRNILLLDNEDSHKVLTHLPLNNWVLLINTDVINHASLEQFAAISIDKGLIYMCAAGPNASEVDDLFDYAFMDREQSGQGLPEWYKGEDDVLMTSWHNDLGEAFYFAVMNACYDTYSIDTVVILNCTASSILEELMIRVSELS